MNKRRDGKSKKRKEKHLPQAAASECLTKCSPFLSRLNRFTKKATIRNVREKKSVRRRILVIYKNKWCFRERLSALGFLSTCSFPLGAGALSRVRSGLNEIFGSFLSSECGFCSCYSSAWLTENR